MLVRIVLRRRLGHRTALATVVLGAGLAVAAHLFHREVDGTADYRGVFVHVDPYAVATLVALGGSRRQ